MFYSKKKPRKTISLAVGPQEKNTYFIHVDEKGHKEVKAKGKTNFYKKIQENAEECKIENIIKRATLGDTTALNRRVAEYFDATEMPTNLAEAQQAIINMESIFSSLPLEIRKEYNHSPQQFIADFGSAKWLKVMGITKEPTPEVVPEPTPEVVNG